MPPPGRDEDVLLRIEGQTDSAVRALTALLSSMHGIEATTAATQRQLALLNQSNDRLVDSITGLAAKVITANQALELTGKVATGVASAIRLVREQTIGAANEFGQWARQIDLTSRQLGVSAPLYQAISARVTSLGADVNEVSKAIQQFTVMIDKAGRGDAVAVRSFAALGVTIRDVKTNAIRPLVDVLQEATASLGVMDNKARKSALGVELFGTAVSAKTITAIQSLDAATLDLTNNFNVLSPRLQHTGEQLGEYQERISLATQALEVHRRAILATAALPFFAIQANTFEFAAEKLHEYANGITMATVAAQAFSVVAAGVFAYHLIHVIASMSKLAGALAAVGIGFVALKSVLTELVPLPPQVTAALAPLLHSLETIVNALFLAGGIKLAAANLPWILSQLGLKAAAASAPVAALVTLIGGSTTLWLAAGAAVAALVWQLTSLAQKSTEAEDKTAKLLETLNKLRIARHQDEDKLTSRYGPWIQALGNLFSDPEGRAKLTDIREVMPYRKGQDLSALSEEEKQAAIQEEIRREQRASGINLIDRKDPAYLRAQEEARYGKARFAAQQLAHTDPRSSLNEQRQAELEHIGELEKIALKEAELTDKSETDKSVIKRGFREQEREAQRRFNAEIEQMDRDHGVRLKEIAIHAAADRDVFEVDQRRATARQALQEHRITQVQFVQEEQQRASELLQIRRREASGVKGLIEPARDPERYAQQVELIEGIERDHNRTMLGLASELFDAQKQQAERQQSILDRIRGIELDAVGDPHAQMIHGLAVEYRELAKVLREAGLESELERLGAAFQKLATDASSTFVDVRGSMQGFLADIADIGLGSGGIEDSFKSFTAGIRRSFAEGFAEALLEKVGFEGKLRLNVNREIPDIAAQGASNWARPWAAAMNWLRGGSGVVPSVNVTPFGTVNAAAGGPTGFTTGAGAGGPTGFRSVGTLGGSATRRGGVVVEDALGQRFGVQSEADVSALQESGAATPAADGGTGTGAGAGAGVTAGVILVDAIIAAVGEKKRVGKVFKNRAQAGNLTKAVNYYEESDIFVPNRSTGALYKKALSHFFSAAGIPNKQVQTKWLELPPTEEARQRFAEAGFDIEGRVGVERTGPELPALIAKGTKPGVEEMRTQEGLAFGLTFGKGERSSLNLANAVISNFELLGFSADMTRQQLLKLMAVAGVDLPTALDRLNDRSAEGRLTQEQFRAAIEGNINLFMEDYPRAIDTVAIANRFFEETTEGLVINTKRYLEYLDELANTTAPAVEGAVRAVFDTLDLGLTGVQRREKEIGDELEKVDIEGRIKSTTAALDRARLFGDEAEAALQEMELSSLRIKQRAVEKVVSPAEAFGDAIKEGVRTMVLDKTVEAIINSGLIQDKLEPFFAVIARESEYLATKGLSAADRSASVGRIIAAGNAVNIDYSVISAITDPIVRAAHQPGGFFGPSVAMAHGGLITGPTRALLGENGPELVVPLNQSGMSSIGPTINVYIDNPTILNDADADRFADLVGTNIMNRVTLNQPYGR